jgi:pSer/pThr/pTyr-binding forkhead associated (FHA) protein
MIPAGSRAVLIGVSHYQAATYLSYPAVGNSLAAMEAVLTDFNLCGWPKESVTTISDPINSARLIAYLRSLASNTTGVLLFYFVGHGVVSEHGELCLAVADTDPANPDTTGLEYAKIKKMLHTGTPAVTRVAILDSCFSGRAIGLAATGTQLADLSAAAGAYTLTAADDIAHVVPLAQQSGKCTTFTGELIDLIRSGIPGGPAELTLGTIYTHLRYRLGTMGMPLPNQRSDDNAAQWIFSRNPHVINHREPEAIRLTSTHTWYSTNSTDFSMEPELPAPVSTGWKSAPPQQASDAQPSQSHDGLHDSHSPQWVHTGRLMVASLQLDDGSGRTYSLIRGSNLVGRGRDVHFRLPDTGVARRHLEIVWDGQTAVLADLNSSNGTTVNGTPVLTWQLAHGDVIRIGHSSLVFRADWPQHDNGDPLDSYYLHQRDDSGQSVVASLQLKDGSGRMYSLKLGDNFVGRGQDVHFRLPDTGVDQRHLEIAWDGYRAILSDLGSTNGTTVNGTPVQTWQLADGDVIRIGHSSLTFSVRT